MHCKHLGIDKHLLGSCLYVLVHYILPDEPDANLAVIWRDIEHFYNELNSEDVNAIAPAIAASISISSVCASPELQPME